MKIIEDLPDQAFQTLEHVMFPVWVFCTENLRIITANQATQDWLGFDLQTLQSMTIADLWPESERARIIEKVRRFEGATADAGTWTIVGKGGEHFSAHFSWSRARFNGDNVIVASIRDLKPVVRAETLAASLTAQNALLRRDVSLSAEYLSWLVDGLPGKIVVLTPLNYTVVAVSDEYAEAVKLTRDIMIGRGFFELFPDDPSNSAADGFPNLKISFQRVQAMRATDTMPFQRQPLRQPDGTFEERLWLTTNKPVLDARGNIIYIIHRVEDFTEIFAEGEISGGTDGSAKARLAESRIALSALSERETRLRSAELLLDLGSWEFDIDRQTLNWSEKVFEIYGAPQGPIAPDFDRYVQLVHPDDREEMLSTYQHFVESNAPELEFQHRIIRADGGVTYVRGLGSRHCIDGREIVIGFVQDITSIKRVEEELWREVQRRQLASRLVSLGSWKYVVGQPHVVWDSETAAIHDEPEDISPSVENGISYYIPEHQGLIRDRFEACVQDGAPFDEICQIVTAKSRTVWVRAIGEPVRDESGKIVGVHGAFQDISELIEAKDVAAQLSDRLHVTLEAISDGFCLLDGSWRFTFVNGMAEKISGRNRNELLGRSIWDEFPEMPGNVRVQYEIAVSERRPVRFEQYYSNVDIWFEINADPTPQGLAVYFRDITEQRGRYEQLRLLEAAASRLNDILLITEAEPIDGPDGPKIVYVNDAFERRTGFSRAEVIGKTPSILQGPKTQRPELDRVRNALKNWEPVRAELINYTKAGEQIWLELDIVPLANDAGWYTHWVAVERDISERKQVEETLKANEERLRLATRAGGSAIWEWDIVTDAKWWSEGLQEIFGHQLDRRTNSTESIRKNYVHPEDLGGFLAAHERLASGDDSKFDETYRFRRGDGSWAIVEDKAFAIRNSAGAAIRILGIMTDVTERKQLEERLRQSQKMEVIGQLTGGVSHDFNNLLTVILGNAEILEEQLSAYPNLQKLARMSLEAAERGAQLTNQLLAFSRKQPLDPKVIDVAKLVQGMDGLLRRTLPESISIEIVRSGGLWQIDADPTQLESALLNLAVNARDAMPEGGYLTIEIANAMLDDDYIGAERELKPGQYVVITVTDTGHGIAQEVLGKVFEPFFTTKDVGKGSGLGLSMVFGFVKQSDGHVRVYSEPGDGTSFKLYFPRSRSAQEGIVVPQAQSKIVGGSEQVLVVEDDPAVREYVSAQLRGLGYEVYEASSGKDGVEVLLRMPKVDLLFTDVVMPGGMSGHELAKIAREMQPEIAVLFTSGYTENSIVHEGRLDPGIKLLSKPYRRQQLAAKIREALNDGDL